MHRHGTSQATRLTNLLSRPLLVKRITRSISTIPSLASWDLDAFRSALTARSPRRLPRTAHALPPACTRWFIHDHDPSFDLAAAVAPPQRSDLKPSFWERHKQVVVPLELSSEQTFERVNGPLELLLTHVVPPAGTQTCMLPTSGDPSYSVYLAQCDMRDLPATMQADLPTPVLVQHAGKGDLYASSLWMGKPPTYTPLHRDPNPNILMQIAGRKVVRMFQPDVGRALFEHVRGQLPGSAPASSVFRGEEMMVGREKELLYDLVWSDEYANVLQHVHEARIGVGEALFIPKGWWHSVKGEGEGVSASANWWFR